jgi:hypothetical protein
MEGKLSGSGPDRFTTGKRTPPPFHTHSKRGSAAPEPVRTRLRGEKVHCPCRESYLGRPARSVVIMWAKRIRNDVHLKLYRWATGWIIGGSSPGRGWKFFSSPPCPDRLWSPSSQWIPEALSLVVKRPGREAEYSPPSSAEVKNAWSYVYTLPNSLHGTVLS